MIDLFIADLSGFAAEVTRLRSSLSADERARAERFHSPRDRSRFITARGILRYILADYLESAPHNPQFCYGAEGKPRLVGSAGLGPAKGPEFNLAHANEIAVYAVARDEVGIDVEHIEPDLDFAAVLETAATPGEQDRFLTLPRELRAKEFFAWWTRKEAYVKAIGRGLSISPDSFEVPVLPVAREVVVRMQDGPWKLETFAPAPGYIATVAARGARWKTCLHPARAVVSRRRQSAADTPSGQGQREAPPRQNRIQLPAEKLV
jgi:4'-phosphopantetheinyl transferase